MANIQSLLELYFPTFLLTLETVIEQGIQIPYLQGPELLWEEEFLCRVSTFLRGLGQRRRHLGRVRPM